MTVCEHGGLRRKCEVCELRDENERLREALAFKHPDSTLSEAQALAFVMQALAVIARELPERRELAQRAKEGVDALKEQGTRIRQDAIRAAVSKVEAERDALRALLREARVSVEMHDYDRGPSKDLRNLLARIDAAAPPA